MEKKVPSLPSELKVLPKLFKTYSKASTKHICKYILQQYIIKTVLVAITVTSFRQIAFPVEIIFKRFI